MAVVILLVDEFDDFALGCGAAVDEELSVNRERDADATNRKPSHMISLHPNGLGSVNRVSIFWACTHRTRLRGRWSLEFLHFRQKEEDRGWRLVIGIKGRALEG